MQTFVSPIFLVAMFVGILALAATVIGFFLRPAKQARFATVAVILPAFIMLVLFYSLAIHMHQSLGAWPNSIGERGFPSALVSHAQVVQCYFSVLLLLSVFVWPVVFIICLAVRRWRICLYYLGLYALSSLLCLGGMLLAPSEFLNWWWD